MKIFKVTLTTETHTYIVTLSAKLLQVKKIIMNNENYQTEINMNYRTIRHDTMNVKLWITMKIQEFKWEGHRIIDTKVT